MRPQVGNNRVKDTKEEEELENNYVLYVVIVTTAGTPWLPSGIHT